MKQRVRCARWRATIKGKDWMFTWEPRTHCLCYWPKYGRKKKVNTVTVESLLDLLNGQMQLL